MSNGFKEVKYEGFWITEGKKNNKHHSLPSKSLEDWFIINKPAIVKALKKIESIIHPLNTTIYHTCLFCGETMPQTEFVCSSPSNTNAIYSWPSHFFHYVTEHDVCPTSDFLKDILNIDKKESEDPNDVIFRIWQALNAKDKEAFLDKVSALRSVV